MSALTWIEISSGLWQANIGPDSNFEITLENGEYNLRILATILSNNPFGMPFPTLDEAKQKAEDLYQIFEGYGKDLGEEQEDLEE